MYLSIPGIIPASPRIIQNSGWSVGGQEMGDSSGDPAMRIALVLLISPLLIHHSITPSLHQGVITLSLLPGRARLRPSLFQDTHESRPSQWCTLEIIDQAIVEHGAHNTEYMHHRITKGVNFIKIFITTRFNIKFSKKILLNFQMKNSIHFLICEPKQRDLEIKFYVVVVMW